MERMAATARVAGGRKGVEEKESVTMLQKALRSSIWSSRRLPSRSTESKISRIAWESWKRHARFLGRLDEM